MPVHQQDLSGSKMLSQLIGQEPGMPQNHGNQEAAEVLTDTYLFVFMALCLQLLLWSGLRSGFQVIYLSRDFSGAPGEIRIKAVRNKR